MTARASGEAMPASVTDMQWLDHFEAASARVLMDAGLPASAAELQVPEKPKRRPPIRNRKRHLYMTVGARIEADVTLPGQVRLAARIVDQCALLRAQLATGSSIDAAADTAVLFGLVTRLIVIDSAPVIEAGANSIKSRADATHAGKAKADKRAVIAKCLYAEELDRNPHHLPTVLCDAVAERVPVEYPKLFKVGFTGKAIGNLLKRKIE
jgi:hypothetical protein